MATKTQQHVTRISPAGDSGILVELDSPAAVLSLQQQLISAPAPGQLDVVPAAATVLITTSIPGQVHRLASHVRSLDLSAVHSTQSGLRVIDTVYDGADLDEVAAATGLSVEAVIASHTGQAWTAAFLGFAPGFAYLTGENHTLDVPRRASPRTAVPTGAVALAGGYSAIYPRQSPGGWQLIGHTTSTLWDLNREQPALIRTGDTVRFRAIRHTALLTNASATPTTTTTPADAGGVAGLQVLDAGLQATVQDLGRPGFADLGVTTSGALDQRALRRANRLAGNPAEAAGLELLAGGFRIEALQDQVMAVTGALVSLQITPSPPNGREATARPAPLNAPFALLAGETLSWSAPATGLRSYLAVRGGIDVPLVLGSRSTDTLSGVGPEPLRNGSRLAVLPAPVGSVVGWPEPAGERRPEVEVLRLVPGPRSDWFSPDALQEFCSREWTVTQQSNRIGLRLSGPPVQRTRTDELASEGTVQGAVQVPPGGEPVLFLADHPVTGGYPVIGVVATADLDLAAQLAPGSRVRFRLTDTGTDVPPPPGAAAAGNTTLRPRPLSTPSQGTINA
jgi:KipI family sensor histidine kinase inhibitor